MANDGVRMLPAWRPQVETDELDAYLESLIAIDPVIREYFPVDDNNDDAPSVE